MLITFPNMGNVCYAMKAMFDAMQVPYVMPEPSTKETLRIGSFHSPDEMCLPFKIMMGNYFQSIDKGADTILLVGSCGPCRFGEYCELQMKIMKRLDYDLDFIVVEAPNIIGWEEFKNRVGKIAASSSLETKEKFKAIKYACQALKLLDDIEARAHYLAGYEINSGECKRILYECREAVLASRDLEMLGILKKYKMMIDNIKIDINKDPLKIAIIGEIYTIIDPLSNFYIEEKLMDYGVSTKRMLTPSWWVKDLFLKPLKINSYKINKAAKEYLPCKIGGHGRECVGEALLSVRNKMDGAIQIFPLGCMPEVVAKSVLPSIQRDKDFPIMSLVIDEMTAEAGYITRLEAFLDMLEMRKNPRLIAGERSHIFG